MHQKRFFDELGRIWKPSRDHDCTLVLGDFNAKLYQKFVSDTDMLGDYVFVSSLPKKGISLSNRELLMENCKATGSVVANTFFEHDEERLVTYYGLGTCPNEDITVEGFSQIDHCLVHKNTLGKIVDVWSDRSPSLQSRHFLIQVLADIGFDCLPLPEKPKKYCFSGKIHTGPNIKTIVCGFANMPRK